MSVVRGRPPGLAGGMNGSSSRYWSSLSAWPDPKSPTSTRSSSVHIEASQPESPPERRHHNRPALVKPTSTPFQNRLLDQSEFGPCAGVLLLSGDAGSSRSGSSCFGEFTRVEIDHMRITSGGNGRKRSRGSAS